MSARIDEVPALDAKLTAAVVALTRDAPEAADNPPISERGLLQLRSSRPVRHLVAWSDPQSELATESADPDGGERLIGYAQLDGAGTVPSAELVATDPSTAAALLAKVAELASDSGVLLWAHGEASAANQAALRAGLVPQRSLLQLRRGLADLSPNEPTLPAGVRLRPFEIGRDEQAWLAVNGRAFASHPEQGSWTERDLAERLSATWFDPAGFLLAERDGASGPELVGFHWTKVHPAIGTSEPLGEVYVLGIDPAAQGLRLGTALLDAGLRHLRSAGLSTVLLYVDESNSAAVHLYARAGFTVFATDIQYSPR
ncbi:MAG: mycothiol synthase [Jatrophihabitantaceae bacterium]